MAVTFLRSRRRPEPDPVDENAKNTETAEDDVNDGADDDVAADGKEPVAAGTRLRASSWRYSDMP
jgi:hypothetical protein